MQRAVRRWLTLAAVFLLGALCGLVIPPMIIQRSLRAEHDRHVKLTADIHTLRTELDHYKAANGSYPTTDQGLRVLSVTLKDPWGHDYIYRSPGIPHHDPYDVFSAGPDGKPNTVDDDWGD
jgi:general secretion pathway protein G